MRFLAGVVVGVVIGNPVWHAAEKRMPTAVHKKMLEGLERINERIVAYGERLHQRIEDER